MSERPGGGSHFFDFSTVRRNTARFLTLVFLPVHLRDGPIVLPVSGHIVFVLTVGVLFSPSLVVPYGFRHFPLTRFGRSTTSTTLITIAPFVVDLARVGARHLSFYHFRYCIHNITYP